MDLSKEAVARWAERHPDSAQILTELCEDRDSYAESLALMRDERNQTYVERNDSRRELYLANKEIERVTKEVEGLIFYIGQLRHAYTQLASQSVQNQNQFAEGLISPIITQLETLYISVTQGTQK